MKPGWHPVNRIKDEVGREGIGWLSGGFLSRQLKAAVLLVPAFAAIMRMADSSARRAIVGVSIALWFAWMLCTLAIGILFLCRWADRDYDRKGRHQLSKDYRDS